MTQSSLVFWYSVANGAYLVGVIIAAVGSLGLYFLGNRVSKAKDDELRRFQTESAIQITAAKEGTAKALKEAADANKAAEGLRLDAERERLARLQLEARLAPRILTPQQQTAIVALLKPLGRFRAQILLHSDVTEVSRLSRDIASTLTRVGWDVAEARPSGGAIVEGVGILVSNKADDSVKKAAGQLATELTRNGVGAKLETMFLEDLPIPAIIGARVPNPQIAILIGTK